MTGKYRISIVSPPDRENLVAEIFFGEFQWAEVSHEKNDFEIEFYPRPDHAFWQLSFVDAISSLAEAQQRLKDIG